jgi:hypothetical protein
LDNPDAAVAESYIAFLIKSCVQQKMPSDLIIKVVQGRKANLSTDTLLLYAETL